MDRLAQVSDLEAWPGVTVGPDETANAEAVLDAVSAYVRLESGDPSRWPTTAEVPEAIKHLTVIVAARVWRNPDVATRVDVGPFSEQFNKAVDDALYLSSTDKTVIARSVPSPKLFTIATCRGDEYLDTVLIPVTGFDDPFPLDAWGNAPVGGADCGW